MGKNEKKQLKNSGLDIPDYAIERIARCMLPLMRKYFESEEGQKELTEWNKTHSKEDN